MDNQRLNNYGLKVPQRGGSARSMTAIPWSLLALTLTLHAVLGLLLSVFSPPYWVWPIAFGGTFIQTFVLAGPRALSSLKGKWLFLSRFVTCLGVALTVVALAIAVGFGGTSDIDNIRFSRIGLVLFFINLGVLLLTASCSLLIAYIGDRLLAGMGRIRCSVFILSFCFLGLLIGGAFGLAIAS